MATLSAGFAFTGCSDDDETVKTPLSSVQATSQAKTRQLTFSWEKVAGCTQYGYEFSPVGSIETPAGGVTTNTSVTFTGLQPATEYELRIWAFADINSDFTTSPVYTLKASTAGLIALATPVVTVEVVGPVANVKWEPVDGAAYYTYSYEIEGKVTTGSTSATTLKITDVPMGTHTVSVVAIPSDDDHSESDAGVAQFTRQSVVVMSATGRYYSYQTGGEWDALIEKTDDGMYTIYAWYGVEGYDLVFTLAADNSGEIEILNAVSTDSSGYQYVPTGVSSIGNLPCYPSDGCSSLTASSSGGTLMLYAWANDWGADYFIWGDGGSGKAPLTIDDIIGQYSVNSTGYTYDYDTDDWVEATCSGIVTIEMTGENQIVMKNFYWDDTEITGTVDLEKLTITFDVQKMDQWYTFADPNYDSNWNLNPIPVVATIDETTGNITLGAWATIYQGYTYDEFDSTVLEKL